MPKASVKVLSTDVQIRAASACGDRTDFRIRGAPGLQLRVSSSGTKTWALAYKSPATGKWAKIALGHYDAVGLVEAKNLAGDLAAEIRKGRDPIRDKRQEAGAETFETLASRYMAEHKARPDYPCVSVTP